MDNFTFCPWRVIPGKVTHRVLSIQYGDGYEQAVGDGINTMTQEWNLTFRGKPARIALIRAFLDAHKGYQAFTWTSPLEVPGSYRAKEYSFSETDNRVHEINVTFKQVY